MKKIIAVLIILTLIAGVGVVGAKIFRGEEKVKWEACRDECRDDLFDCNDGCKRGDQDCLRDCRAEYRECLKECDEQDY